MKKKLTTSRFQKRFAKIWTFAPSKDFLSSFGRPVFYADGKTVDCWEPIHTKSELREIRDSFTKDEWRLIDCVKKHRKINKNWKPTGKVAKDCDIFWKRVLSLSKTIACSKRAA